MTDVTLHMKVYTTPEANFTDRVNKVPWTLPNAVPNDNTGMVIVVHVEIPLAPELIVLCQ